MSVFAKPEAFGGPVAGPALSGPPAPRPVAPRAATSAFRRTTDALNLPTRVVTLPRSCWAPDYPAAPGVDVQVGLRVYSEGEAVKARAAAAQRAWRLHPQPEDEEERVRAGNGALMAHLVALCATKPQDRSTRYFGSPQGGAEDVVPLALTPGGIEYLYGELDALVSAENPNAREASDADVEWLAAVLASGALSRLSPREARRVRRLLGAAVDRLR